MQLTYLSLDIAVKDTLRLKDMAQTSQIYATPSWKKTTLGTPIPLYASAEPKELANQRPILWMGGIHGDEPEGVALALRTLAWLKLQNDNLVIPWVLIPCLNVDGYRDKQRVNGRGVDLNRNYPSKSWAPSFENPRYSPGPSAGSEVEVQGVVELIATLSPRLIVHCHSWNPCVVCTGEPGRRAAQALGRSSGYDVVDEIGYPTPGSLSQYGWHDHGIPVICIEEQENLGDLSLVWKHFEEGVCQIFRKDSHLWDEP